MHTETEILRLLQDDVSTPIARSIVQRTKTVLGVPALDRANPQALLKHLSSALSLFLEQPRAVEVSERIADNVRLIAPITHRIELSDASDLSAVLNTVREMCAALVFNPITRSRAVVVTHELARNILQHAGSGRIDLRMIGRAKKLVIVAHDDGPGIADVDATLQASLAGPAGGLSGLGIVQNAASDFDVHTSSQGTTVSVELDLSAGYP